MNFEGADRLKKLPPYLFSEIDKAKRELVAKGKDVIDLGVGDPDLPTPDFIVDALHRAAQVQVNQRYALDQGMPELRQAIAKWYQERFSVKLDPETEILPLIGSKEGIAHLPLAVLNPGDVSLVPDPCYPPYKSGTWFAGAETHLMPLLEESGFLPDFSQIEEEPLKRARLLYLNYPNNPTGACASKDFFKNTVSFAKENSLLVCHDAAYSELSFDGYRPPSFLEIPGAKEVGVEFHSLSKTFNMTGWRVGFACGNASAIAHLGKVKSNIDSGIFKAIQLAAVQALTKGRSETERMCGIYARRRDVVVGGFSSIGWNIRLSKATFYVWIEVPPGYTSQELCMRFLREAHVVVVPGNGFGANGEGYFRIALTVPEARLEEAMQRIQKIRH